MVKEKKYDVTVQYKDGGEDKFYRVTYLLRHGILEVYVNQTQTVYIMLSNVTNFKSEVVEYEGRV